MTYDGKVALITGSSRGIGRQLAQELGTGGASVVINYKKTADLAEQVRKEIEQAGGRAITVAADMEEPKDIDRLFATAAETYGRLDYYVCNAAATAFKPIMDLRQHHLDRSYAMNMRAFVLGAQHAVNLMPDGGRIVALSGYGSIRAYPTYASLGAAKAAIEAWVRYMAAEFAPRRINVNAVTGGIIESDSSAYFYDIPGMAPLEKVLPQIPLRRMGTVGDMVGVIEFLLSPASAYLTGQSLMVDGGLSIVGPPFPDDLTAPLAAHYTQ